MNKIVLARHGQSYGNKFYSFFRNDATNFLTPEGQTQSKLLGNFLIETDFQPSTVFSSTLTRSCQTARLILTHMGKPDFIINYLNELNELMYRPTRNRGEGVPDEDFDMFCDRVCGCFYQVIEPQLKYGNVLVICHRFTIIAILNGINHEKIKNNNLHNIDIPHCQGIYI